MVRFATTLASQSVGRQVVTWVTKRGVQRFAPSSVMYFSMQEDKQSGAGGAPDGGPRAAEVVEA